MSHRSRSCVVSCDWSTTTGRGMALFFVFEVPGMRRMRVPASCTAGSAIAKPATSLTDMSRALLARRTSATRSASAGASHR